MEQKVSGGRRVKITKRQLRRIIRESLRTSESLTTPEQFRQLQPGDRLSFNGRVVVVFRVDPMVAAVEYVEQGRASRKYFDYRMALVDEPGELPEYNVMYLGPGPAPENTRLARR